MIIYECINNYDDYVGIFYDCLIYIFDFDQFLIYRSLIFNKKKLTFANYTSSLVISCTISYSTVSTYSISFNWKLVVIMCSKVYVRENNKKERIQLYTNVANFFLSWFSSLHLFQPLNVGIIFYKFYATGVLLLLLITYTVFTNKCYKRCLLNNVTCHKHNNM